MKRLAVLTLVVMLLALVPALGCGGEGDGRENVSVFIEGGKYNGFQTETAAREAVDRLIAAGYTNVILDLGRSLPKEPRLEYTQPDSPHPRQIMDILGLTEPPCKVSVLSGSSSAEAGGGEVIIVTPAEAAPVSTERLPSPDSLACPGATKHPGQFQVGGNEDLETHYRLSGFSAERFAEIVAWYEDELGVSFTGRWDGKGEDGITQYQSTNDPATPIYGYFNGKYYEVNVYIYRDAESTDAHGGPINPCIGIGVLYELRLLEDAL